MLKIFSLRKNIYPLLMEYQGQPKAQFHQSSTWGTNEFIGLREHGWGVAYRSVGDKATTPPKHLMPARMRMIPYL